MIWQQIQVCPNPRSDRFARPVSSSHADLVGQLDVGGAKAISANVEEDQDDAQKSLDRAAMEFGVD